MRWTGQKATTEDIMKITTDYIVGNTAIQIVNTGKKIKVVDVEKEKKKKDFLKAALLTVVSTAVLLACCFSIVTLHNTSNMLDQKNYALKSEIDELERKNAVLARESENVEIDYHELYKKAKEMGMDFPARDQVYEYDAEKSTAVRINPSSGH